MPADPPFVSVVTPVYNTEAYIGECIESVLRQTCTNFEYVILDNQSTDATLSIAESYAARDQRVRVVKNKTFLTQPQNYNEALRQISPRSKYCKMVQADDWIFPTCIERMVALAEADPEVALVGAYQLAGHHVLCQGLPCRGPDAPCSVIAGRDACRLFLMDGKYIFGTPTSVLYRSQDVIGKPAFYKETSFFEDSEICFELLERAKFGFVHEVLTFTRIDNESIYGQQRQFDQIAMHLYVVLRNYGARYLSSDERDRRLRTVRSTLYDCLSRAPLGEQREAFWRFYRRGFEMAGDRINPGRIAAIKGLRWLRWIGNPLFTLTEIGRRIAGASRGRP